MSSDTPPSAATTNAEASAVPVRPPLPRRRSPRLEELANTLPTLRQLAQLDAQERFVRNVSPRLSKAGSPRRPRTRAQKAASKTQQAVVTGPSHASASRVEMDEAQRVSKRAHSPHVDAADDADPDGVEEGEDKDADDVDDGEDEQSEKEGEEEAGDGDDGEEEQSEEEQTEEEEEEEQSKEEDEEEGEQSEEEEEGDHVSTMSGRDHVRTKSRTKPVTNQVTDKPSAKAVEPPLVELSDEPVVAPPLVELHDDWDSWLLYEITYSKETFQILSVKNTLNATRYNFIISKQVKGLNLPLPVEPVLQWVHDTQNGWRIQVKPRVMWHSHRVGPQVYKLYPMARGVKDEDTRKRGQEMVADGMGRTKIYSFSLDRGETVFNVDVDNFINENRSRISNEDDNTATAIVLARVANKDPSSVITVDATERHETGVISITTTHMRAMGTRFAHVLLIDCTHKTNRYNYQLCTMMVMNEYGAGQVVQQSLFETNGDWHMERALEHFKRANPDSWRLVQVIMVDKDLNEIKVLKRFFPEARVLICHFHVIKYLGTMSHKPEFGKISSEDHRAIDNCVHNLVYSDTEEDYETNKAAFQDMCTRVGFLSFAAYVEKNWFSCPEMWVMYMRKKLPHLRNHTNNRLESWFGKFKQSVSDNASMSVCVLELMAAAKRCQKDYEYLVTRPGQHYNAQYGREMQSVLAMSTPFVAKAVEQQFDSAVNKFDKYRYEEVPDEHYVIVRGRQEDRVVDTTDWSCDCEFSMTMLLPCRHAMAYRRHKAYPEIIPLTRLDVRWKRATCVPAAVKQFLLNTAPAPSSPSRKRLAELRQADSATRYNEALRRLQPICSELAEISDAEEFNGYLDFLEEQFRNVRKRKRTGAIQMRESEQSPTSVPHHVDVELSQANSLRSEEVGDVPAPTLHTLKIQRPGELIEDEGVSTTRHGGDVTKHGEDMVGDDEEEMDQDTHVRAEDIRVSINENTSKSGRPKLDKKAVAVAQRQDRVIFNETEKARRMYGELTLRDVVDALDTERPRPADVRKRLAGVVVRHSDAANKRPIYVVQQKPMLNLNAYYVLPPTLLKAYIEKFPLATRPGEAIHVGTPEASRAATPKSVGTPDAAEPPLQ